jgi:uncharacterized protein YjiS (DUF1127 family)
MSKMDTNRNCPYFVPGAAIPRAIWPLTLQPARIFTRLVHWGDRSAQRRQLAQLDDRMLKDIGVGRSEAYRECSKWFWQD